MLCPKGQYKTKREDQTDVCCTNGSVWNEAEEACCTDGICPDKAKQRIQTCDPWDRCCINPNDPSCIGIRETDDLVLWIAVLVVLAILTPAVICYLLKEHCRSCKIPHIPIKLTKCCEITLAIACTASVGVSIGWGLKIWY